MNGTATMPKDDNPPVVFIVDDDPDIRSSLSRALRLRGHMVESFDSADAFLAHYDEGMWGCLILDQGLPGMTGLELQRHMNERGSLLPIIFITGHGGVPESVQAIKGGAVDFLEKPFRQTDLIDRINAALDAARIELRSADRKRVTLARFDRLTPREREIVDHMLSNPSEVSSKGIARALDISPRTVDHHRARILEKLQVSSVAELIDLARRVNEAPQPIR